ncbi:DEAD-box ATP-dependent RNA helicase 53, mitochondrial [Nymphon striatum]|nr:DEAD-box ATP-dependent RNA helicase 53, mitochondrial [Nymphon striatum]
MATSNLAIHNRQIQTGLCTLAQLRTDLRKIGTVSQRHDGGHLCSTQPCHPSPTQRQLTLYNTLADALSAKGYDTLTAVQEACLNPEVEGRDLLVSAQTGSGKTIGFGLAIAPQILGDSDRFERAAAPLALVIAPTRELAMQVKRELDWLYKAAGAVVVSTVGGMDMRDERRALERGSHIVVATPGRLRDHVMRGSINMDRVEGSRSGRSG